MRKIKIEKKTLHVNVDVYNKLEEILIKMTRERNRFITFSEALEYLLQNQK